MSSRPIVRFLDRTTPPHIFTLIAITGFSGMAMNMFLPSLPRIAEHFGTEYKIVQLSVASFLAMNGLLQIFIGPISDRFGRRKVLLAGFAIFSISSVGCVFAPNIETFLAFRMIQATVAVAMVMSRAIVRDMVPQSEAASMIGYITMFMAIIPLVSPAVGGYMDEVLGWKSVFWFFAISGAAAYALIWVDLGETNKNTSSSFRQQFSEYPELLLSQRFWGYCLSAAFASGAFFAYIGGAPFVGSVVFNLAPSTLGYYLGAPALGYILGNYLSGRYSTRTGINRMILIGTAVSTFGSLLSLMVFQMGFGSILSFFGLMTSVGLGNGMVLPNATSGMLSVRPHLAGTASGLGGAMMIGGGGALSALAGALLKPETGPFPLLWIMFIVSFLAVCSILWVIRRERSGGFA
jgi:DHA1 family bicyclomycin/chloramphenicol resistance-like MFS transporter